MVVLRASIEEMSLEELSMDDGEDALEVFGGHMDTSVKETPDTPSASSDMSIDSDSTVRPTPPADTPADGDGPGPPSTPPPPPPDDQPPPPPPSLPRAGPTFRMIRWAKYDTDLFDSDRLMAFTTARPLPLGC